MKARIDLPVSLIVRRGGGHMFSMTDERVEINLNPAGFPVWIVGESKGFPNLFWTAVMALGAVGIFV